MASQEDVRMKTGPVNHIGVTVSSIEHSIRWYHEIFGCELVAEEYFDVDAVNHLHMLLGVRDASLRTAMEPQRNAGVDWVYLKDPDGNLIELMDMHMMYPVIRYFGGLLGKVLRRTKFKKYVG